MFHIGVATQHPPLPEPGQLSELGINFIKQCLTLDPALRPTAAELLDHPWMIQFGETLLGYGDGDLASIPPVEIPRDPKSDMVWTDKPASIFQERDVEPIQIPSPSSSSSREASPDSD
jgi:mitogen-activated protein kinase kinase kinase